MLDLRHPPPPSRTPSLPVTVPSRPAAPLLLSWSLPLPVAFLSLAMPAERVRPSKRAAAPKGTCLHPPTCRSAAPRGYPTLTPSSYFTGAALDLPATQGIAFAPAVTPGTFNDPPSPIDTLLFPDGTPASGGARRAAHAKKRPENHIPRPPNAFILFRSSFIKNQHVSSEVETNHSTLSKIIGLTWQNLPNEERQVWHAKAKAALEEHKRKFPQYAFRPLHTKGKAPAEKRKVREVEPKDLTRCAKIAELLIEGKKGADLDAAIQEFDRTHVPQVVTRFEAPITARHYRRSSSAPVPDTEHSNQSFLGAEPRSPSKRKTKARSSSPEAPRSPSTPASLYECSTPAPSSPPESEPECDSDYYSSPSPPFAPTPTYALAATNPSFVSSFASASRSTPMPSANARSGSDRQDFSTFSFDTPATPAMPPYASACDPLDQQQQQPQHGVFEAYTQDSQESCMPANMYPPPCHLTIDTSFMVDGCWSTPSSASPLSSVPGTPQIFPVMQANVLDSCFLTDPEQYISQQHIVDTHLYEPYCGDVDLSAYAGAPAQQEFGGVAVPPKGGDFSAFYGRQTLDPVDAGYAHPPYMASLPSFAL